MTDIKKRMLSPVIPAKFPAMLLAAALLVLFPLGIAPLGTGSLNTMSPNTVSLHMMSLNTVSLHTVSLNTASLGALSFGAKPVSAHPALERGRVNADMKGPGPRSARRRPLGTVAVKTYLPRKAGETSGVSSPVFQGILGFYRSVISPVDGNRCVMAPTCSLYSHQAIQEHGVIMGVFLTADRLLHEGDEISRVPRIKEGGETLYVDTLEANTYWWPGWMR